MEMCIIQGLTAMSACAATLKASVGKCSEPVMFLRWLIRDETHKVCADLVYFSNYNLAVRISCKRRRAHF